VCLALSAATGWSYGVWPSRLPSSSTVAPDGTDVICSCTVAGAASPVVVATAASTATGGSIACFAAASGGAAGIGAELTTGAGAPGGDDW